MPRGKKLAPVVLSYSDNSNTGVEKLVLITNSPYRDKILTRLPSVKEKLPEYAIPFSEELASLDQNIFIRIRNAWHLIHPFAITSFSLHNESLIQVQFERDQNTIFVGQYTFSFSENSAVPPSENSMFPPKEILSFLIEPESFLKKEFDSVKEYLLLLASSFPIVSTKERVAAAIIAQETKDNQTFGPIGSYAKNLQGQPILSILHSLPNKEELYPTLIPLYEEYAQLYTNFSTNTPEQISSQLKRMKEIHDVIFQLVNEQIDSLRI